MLEHIRQKHIIPAAPKFRSRIASGREVGRYDTFARKENLRPDLFNEIALHAWVSKTYEEQRDKKEEERRAELRLLSE